MEVPSTAEMDESGVSVELPLDLLWSCLAKYQGCWQQQCLGSHRGAAESPQEPPLHPAHRQMDKQTRMGKPSLFWVGEHRDAGGSHLAQPQPGLSPVHGTAWGGLAPKGWELLIQGNSE